MKYNNTYIAEDLNHFTSFRKKNWFRKEGTLLTFKDSDYTFGARGRKTAGTRNPCIPELLALAGLRWAEI